MKKHYAVIVIGGGHAGTEAAWAASRALQSAGDSRHVLLLTMDPSRTGEMSCNPCIGGLAKGQIVREIDALGGLMGRVADATGVQFRMLNASKGPAVRGPRCQSDKHLYAREIRKQLAARSNLEHCQGLVEDILMKDGVCKGVLARLPEKQAQVVEKPAGQSYYGTPGKPDIDNWQAVEILADAVVLTTGTFMRAIMHTGTTQTSGGRVDEGTADGISGALHRLGFELTRLKTGTPPRLLGSSLALESLPVQGGDVRPIPFSEWTPAQAFPVTSQINCYISNTTAEAHEWVRDHLDVAPMYNGQIESPGPRYCPSLEDKVVRFADRDQHIVHLEPESLEDDSVYCNGVSTSLPAHVQEALVRLLPGCKDAVFLKHGYAVEYDSILAHQLTVGCESKVYRNFFSAGQINGTSGYEEAGAQGLLAGLNAVRRALGYDTLYLGRNQAYIGVMMDDLVTKVPVEPYRMFTSRAEYRLMLRADNASVRLTPVAREWGLIDDQQWQIFLQRQQDLQQLRDWMKAEKHPTGDTFVAWLKKGISLPQGKGQIDAEVLYEALLAANYPEPLSSQYGGGLFGIVVSYLSEIVYEGYIARMEEDVARMKDMEEQRIPPGFAFDKLPGLRKEAAEQMAKFSPETLGQAGRLVGVNPTDVFAVYISIRQQNQGKE